MADEPTCQGSVGPLNDRTCTACRLRYGSQEEPKHPHLCPYCASVIDAQTEQKLEEEHFGWFDLGDE
jgi:uncharacterized protein YlaI